MSETLHEQFTRLVAAGAFDPVRRHLSPVAQDDRMSEALGQVWAMARRKAEQGVRLDDALIVHAVRMRAVDIRRQLPRGGQPRRDVMHHANYVDGKVEVLHLDGLLDEDGDYQREEDRDVHLALLRRTSRDPAPFLDSAIDLVAWLGDQEATDRELLAARYAGDSLKEIAAATGRSISATFARLRRLGRELAERAGGSAGRPLTTTVHVASA